MLALLAASLAIAGYALLPVVPREPRIVRRPHPTLDHCDCFAVVFGGTK